MFLQMALLLAGASIMFEGLVAYRISPYRHLMQRAEWLSVAVSMTLSFFMGRVFGAEGLVCLMAGVMSTVASPFMYKGLNWYEANKADVDKSIKRGKEIMHDLWRLTVMLAKIVTAPFWVPRRVLAFFKDVNTNTTTIP